MVDKQLFLRRINCSAGSGSSLFACVNLNINNNEKRDNYKNWFLRILSVWVWLTETNEYQSYSLLILIVIIFLTNRLISKMNDNFSGCDGNGKCLFRSLKIPREYNYVMMTIYSKLTCFYVTIFGIIANGGFD